MDGDLSDSRRYGWRATLSLAGSFATPYCIVCACIALLSSAPSTGAAPLSVAANLVVSPNITSISESLFDLGETVTNG